ncbi:MAG: hypothetical protein R3C28_06155 [Pirellulaceae bacterium]
MKRIAFLLILLLPGCFGSTPEQRASDFLGHGEYAQAILVCQQRISELANEPTSEEQEERGRLFRLMGQCQILLSEATDAETQKIEFLKQSVINFENSLECMPNHYTHLNLADVYRKLATLTNDETLLATAEEQERLSRKDNTDYKIAYVNEQQGPSVMANSIRNKVAIDDLRQSNQSSNYRQREQNQDHSADQDDPDSYRHDSLVDNPDDRLDDSGDEPGDGQRKTVMGLGAEKASSPHAERSSNHPRRPGGQPLVTEIKNPLAKKQDSPESKNKFRSPLEADPDQVPEEEEAESDGTPIVDTVPRIPSSPFALPDAMFTPEPLPAAPNWFDPTGNATFSTPHAPTTGLTGDMYRSRPNDGYEFNIANTPTMRNSRPQTGLGIQAAPPQGGVAMPFGPNPQHASPFRTAPTAFTPPISGRDQMMQDIRLPEKITAPYAFPGQPISPWNGSLPGTNRRSSVNSPASAPYAELPK